MPSKKIKHDASLDSTKVYGNKPSDKPGTRKDGSESFLNKQGYRAEWNLKSGNAKISTCGVAGRYVVKAVKAEDGSTILQFVDARLYYYASKGAYQDEDGKFLNWNNLPKTQLVFKPDNPGSQNNKQGVEELAAAAEGWIEWDKVNKKFNLILKVSSRKYCVESYKMGGGNYLEFVVSIPSI